MTIVSNIATQISLAASPEVMSDSSYSNTHSSTRYSWDDRQSSNNCRVKHRFDEWNRCRQGPRALRSIRERLTRESEPTRREAKVVFRRL
ncbi:hypothetical protein RvY_01830-2 [Ramazzottius varieornatus]|uniref:Uncharacterized protein n=1 Tax=Ramazzottius varieornatus TaxID=947166 RepID=A0A1D1UL54_RAMVA|nr:hypothetical protein RvY_01830-2 [Ramazzottius varieornatus]